MKHNFRSKVTGQFIPRSSVKVQSGSLYSYKGTVVRAGRDRIFSGNGLPLRHVSIHKSLFGYVPENELRWISKEHVRQYLQEALV